MTPLAMTNWTMPLCRAGGVDWNDSKLANASDASAPLSQRTMSQPWAP